MSKQPKRGREGHYILAGARQLLTMAGATGPRRGRQLGELGIIENGAVLVRDGRIAAVGPTRDLVGACRGDPMWSPRSEGRRKGRPHGVAPTSASIIDVSGKVVMPAFVDSHTHLAFAAPRLRDYEMRIAGRSYQEIARAGGGIQSSVEAVRACPGAVVSTIVYFAQQALSYGTATIEVKSGYGLDVESEIRLLEAIRQAGQAVGPELAPTFLGAHVVPRGCSRKEYLRLVIDEMLPSVAGGRLAEFCDVFCDRLAFSVREAEQVLKAAAGFGMKAKLHGEQLARTGATLLATRLGATSVDHLERAGPREIRALVRSDTIATLLPGATFHLGRHDYAPARALVDGGAAIALATDFNPGTSPTLNMQMILSLACTEMRLSPAEAIAAATVNAAYAVARGHRLGRLEPGLDADIAVFDVEDYREIPYYFGMNHCWMTIKRGNIAWRR